jgi:hypothetical protein
MQSNLKTANSVAVVDYKVPRKEGTDKVPPSFRNILLSYHDYLEVLIKVLFQLATPIKFNRSKEYDITGRFGVTFIIRNLDDAPIAQLEHEFGEKPGSIQKVLEKALHSKTGEAEKNRISVTWVDAGNLESEEQSQTGLTFFELAERSHAVLNEVVAAYTRLLLKLKDDRYADKKLIEMIGTNKSLALKILRNSDNFSTVRQMQEIIDKYAPIVREFHSQGSPHFTSPSSSPTPPASLPSFSAPPTRQPSP